MHAREVTPKRMGGFPCGRPVPSGSRASVASEQVGKVGGETPIRTRKSAFAPSLSDSNSYMYSVFIRTVYVQLTHTATLFPLHGARFLTCAPCLRPTCVGRLALAGLTQHEAPGGRANPATWSGWPLSDVQRIRHKTTEFKRQRRI